MTRPQPSRLLFIDLLRGLAIVIMLETHVFNSLLQPKLKGSSWFAAVSFFNGLVAPSFLFVSGWVFALASQRKLNDLRAGGPALRRQLMRIGLIWSLGYGLHIPLSHQLFKTANGTQRTAFYQIDILHCIAAGLLLLLLARLAIHRDRILESAIWTTGVLIIIATPFFWSPFWNEVVPVRLSGYLGEHQRSLFPLFPWLAFLLLGSACSMGYTRAQKTEITYRYLRRLAVAGIGLAVIGYAFSLYGFPWRYGSENVRTHPMFFAMRMGFVFLVLWACWWWQERGITTGKWIGLMSRESLLVYAGHLIVLYRLPGDGKNLVSFVGNSWNVIQCPALTLALVLLMSAAAMVWGWLKSRHKPVSQYVAYAMAVIVVVSFFLR
jgi:uncharacterized membrane protein